mgnify:CR=1 FL=1
MIGGYFIVLLREKGIQHKKMSERICIYQKKVVSLQRETDIITTVNAKISNNSQYINYDRYVFCHRSGAIEEHWSEGEK